MAGAFKLKFVIFEIPQYLVIRRFDSTAIGLLGLALTMPREQSNPSLQQNAAMRCRLAVAALPGFGGSWGSWLQRQL
jgi:hypothetical protein